MATRSAGMPKPVRKRSLAKTSVAKNKSVTAARPRPVRKPASAARSTQRDTQHAVEQFLFRQAELLDNHRWQEYIDLFTADGVYWMPADRADTTWDGVPSIFAEDRNLMTVRMRRVLHPDAWSQRPLWGTNHLVGNVIIENESAQGDIVVRSRFYMLELRRDTVRHFGGSYVHHLKKTKDGYRIKLQRVDMTNAQAPFEYVLQVWV